MRSLSISWKHIRRSPYQSLAAVITMFLTFLLMGIFSLTTLASVFMLRYFEGKPQITVFFADKAGKDEADALRQTLEATGKVGSAKFVSKEEALALYREQNKSDPLLLEMVTADILPASLEVTTIQPEYLAEVEPIIKKAEGVEEVVYQKDVVDSLLKWTRGIRFVLGGLVGLLAFDAILIIMAITSMKIALKREEIEILRLVGASRWYIRSPFIIEGGLYGSVGALFAWGIITGALFWGKDVLLSFFGIVPVIASLFSQPFDSFSLLLSGAFLFILTGAGFFLGALGSMIAVNRYLKI